MNGHTNARSRQAGLAIVEFALCMPLLAVILLASVEIVNAFNQYSMLAHGVRESVRYVAANSLVGTTDVVANPLPATVLGNARNLVVYGNTAGTGNARLPGLTAGQVTVTPVGTDSVRVAVVYPYQSLLGGSISMFGFGPNISTSFNLTVTNTMRGLAMGGL